MEYIINEFNKEYFMKKYISPTAILLIFLLFNNCDPTETEHELVGTWEMTEVTFELVGGDQVFQADNDNNGTLIINNDNTYSVSFVSFSSPSSSNGTWSIDGNMFLVITEGFPDLSGEYIINSDILTISSSNTPSDYSFIKEIKFQRQSF